VTDGNQDKPAKEPRRLSALIAPYADIILKLTPAILTAVVAWFGASYQSQNAGTSLLNQREQAETQLRATMFANLIGPITGPKKDNALNPEDESLLLELLTLNFHEHIEFKPLLAHADARLSEKQRKYAKGSLEYGELEAMRRSLQSVVRRVRDRQMATLQKECGKNSRLCPVASFAERSRCTSPSTQPAPDAKPLSGNPQCLTFSPDRSGYSPFPHSVVAPDGKYELRLSMGEADWNKRVFKMYVLLGERGPGESQAVPLDRMTPFDFTLTPYDLPFTDNTIVDRDHRFSLVVKDIVPRVEDGKEDEKNVEIWVLWFPEGYVLPHERPVNFQEIRKVLKLD
jgi:hypothetical protein